MQTVKYIWESGAHKWLLMPFLSSFYLMDYLFRKVIKPINRAVRGPIKSSFRPIFYHHIDISWILLLPLWHIKQRLFHLIILKLNILINILHPEAIIDRSTWVFIKIQVPLIFLQNWRENPRSWIIEVSWNKLHHQGKGNTSVCTFPSILD